MKGSSPDFTPDSRRKSIILRHNHIMLPSAKHLSKMRIIVPEH